MLKVQSKCILMVNVPISTNVFIQVTAESVFLATSLELDWLVFRDVAHNTVAIDVLPLPSPKLIHSVPIAFDRVQRIPPNLYDPVVLVESGSTISPWNF